MTDVVFKIEDLARITGLTRRTIRYYIQEGLLQGPEGEKRGAHYLPAHLEALLRIRRLSAAGMSLTAIKALMKGDAEKAPAALPPKPGSTRTCVHIAVAPGVELTVDPAAADISGESLRSLVRRLALAASSQEQNNTLH